MTTEYEPKRLTFKHYIVVCLIIAYLMSDIRETLICLPICAMSIENLSANRYTTLGSALQFSGSRYTYFGG